MRKQPLTMVFLLLMGCFALTIVAFAYFAKHTTPVKGAAETGTIQPTENAINGELLWETVSRQFLTAVFTK
ncbi:MAG: hypothetical protein ICV66_13020 [Chitinophagaceae bacterium]|nr:hypothetical protein [Chitinophagaceae bacterium]